MAPANINTHIPNIPNPTDRFLLPSELGFTAKLAEL